MKQPPMKKFILYISFVYLLCPFSLPASSESSSQDDNSILSQQQLSKSYSKGGCEAPALGPPGPEGPEGPEGPQGPAGPAGGAAGYASFCTHASFFPQPNHLGAYIIEFHKPVLFNQNIIQDFSPPSPLLDITTNPVAISDPSGSEFVGYTDININTTGIYFISWGIVLKDSGSQIALAKVDPGEDPEILELIPCTRLDSGAGNQEISGSTILQLNAGDTLWMINDDRQEKDQQLSSGSQQSGTVTTAFLNIQLIHVIED